SRAAAAAKVALVPGNAFLVRQSDPCRSFRLNFSTPPDEEIVKGIGILARLLNKNARPGA
ncbi:MAG: hypothetical protein LBQ16_04490, partial [Gracilibacteraceae bacterium]|nr:hypothetical protein [Gracilibacteraceae bacterium]